MIKRRGLHRRTFLRGALATGATVAVGLPLLDAMTNTSGTALADGTLLPKRFAVWFWGNGVQHASWHPSTTGADWAPSPQLALLGDDVRPYVNVVSGATLPIRFWSTTDEARRNPHVEGVTGILTGTNPVLDNAFAGQEADWDYMTVGAESIDQTAARILGNPWFPSLEMAVTELGGTPGSAGTAISHIAHAGPLRPLDPFLSPAALFDHVFVRGIMPPDPRSRARASVLDAVRDEARSLSGRLGPHDRIALDAHLEGIRMLERRLSETPEGILLPACSVPAAVADSGSAQVLAARFAELAAYAFACDLTRVCSIQFSAPGSQITYPDVVARGAVLDTQGVATSFHEFVHSHGDDNDAARAVHGYLLENFGAFVRALANRPEAGGSVLDRTVVLGTSEIARGSDHDTTNFPLLLAGRGDGALRYPGVHVRDEGANAARIGLTALKALDPSIERWGSEQFESTEPFDLLR